MEVSTGIIAGLNILLFWVLSVWLNRRLDVMKSIIDATQKQVKTMTDSVEFFKKFQEVYSKMIDPEEIQKVVNIKVTIERDIEKQKRDVLEAELVNKLKLLEDENTGKTEVIKRILDIRKALDEKHKANNEKRDSIIRICLAVILLIKRNYLSDIHYTQVISSLSVSKTASEGMDFIRGIVDGELKGQDLEDTTEAFKEMLDLEDKTQSIA